MSESEKYVNAFDCGHYVWTGRSSAGIAWCATCQAYVGVIVTRRDKHTTTIEYPPLKIGWKP